jgi:hypothetical protein
MYAFVSGGRSPHLNGRKYTSAFRLFLRDDHIEINCHSLKLAKLYPDDTLEFVATTGQVWAAGNSLAQNMTKLLPISFQNFDTGRYKVVHESAKAKWPNLGGYTTAEYTAHHNAWLTTRKEAQEYFQGLILNLKTGEITNPKDMTPEVNADKRKQWLAGLKSFRLRLRAMARVGAFDAKAADAPRYSPYFSTDDLRALADAIMSGEVSEDTARMLRYKTSEWTARKYSSYGEAVVGVFENTVKANSRTLRTFVGVISLKD